jgi:hypothetical protein
MSMEDELSGYDKVSIERGHPMPDMGEHGYRLQRIYRHESAKGGLPGYMVVVAKGEKIHAYRITMGTGFAVKRWKAELLRLTAALMGLDLADVANVTAKAGPEVANLIKSFLGQPEASPYFNRPLTLAVSQGKPKEDGSGFWVNVDPKPATAGATSAPAATTTAQTTASTAKADDAPPPPPADEEKWYDFPAGDPRHGREQYTRSGKRRPKA